MMDTSKKSVISVRNLTMGWPGKILLENVSFDIYEKQIVFIMGGPETYLFEEKVLSTREKKFLKFSEA